MLWSHFLSAIETTPKSWFICVHSLLNIFLVTSPRPLVYFPGLSTVVYSLPFSLKAILLSQQTPDLCYHLIYSNSLPCSIYSSRYSNINRINKYLIIKKMVFIYSCVLNTYFSNQNCLYSHCTFWKLGRSFNILKLYIIR